MSDLISASSLLLAIAALLFSLWYPAIIDALGSPLAEHREDNAAAYVKVTSVLLAKALPVALVSLAVGLIFFPDAWKIMSESLVSYIKSDRSFFEGYDAVRTAYCFVTILSLCLATYMWILVFKLIRLRTALKY